MCSLQLLNTDTIPSDNVVYQSTVQVERPGPVQEDDPVDLVCGEPQASLIGFRG